MLYLRVPFFICDSVIFLSLHGFDSSSGYHSSFWVSDLSYGLFTFGIFRSLAELDHWILFLFVPNCLRWITRLTTNIMDHIWLESAAWKSPPREAKIHDHIWSKSAVWQSPPTRGNFWTTFGQSSLCDKVLRWGAIFGPYLVGVRCVISPPMRGIFF